MFVLVIKVHLQTHAVLRFTALKTHRRTDVGPFVEVRSLQLRWLVKFILGQYQFLQVVEYIGPLIFYRLSIFSKVIPFVLELFY